MLTLLLGRSRKFSAPELWTLTLPNHRGGGRGRWVEKRRSNRRRSKSRRTSGEAIRPEANSVLLGGNSTLLLSGDQQIFTPPNPGWSPSQPRPHHPLTLPGLRWGCPLWTLITIRWRSAAERRVSAQVCCWTSRFFTTSSSLIGQLQVTREAVIDQSRLFISTHGC